MNGRIMVPWYHEDKLQQVTSRH